MLTYVFHGGLGHPVRHLNTFLWWSCQQQWRTKGRLSSPSCGERGKFSTSNFPITETPENVPTAPLLLQGLIFMGGAVKPGKERALLFFVLVDWWKFTLRWRFPFWGPAVPRAVLLYYSRRIISWYSTNSYVPFTSLNLFQIETNPSIFSLRTYACGIYPLCFCAAGNCLLRYWWRFPPCSDGDVPATAGCRSAVRSWVPQPQRALTSCALWPCCSSVAVWWLRFCFLAQGMLQALQGHVETGIVLPEVQSR